MPRPRRNLGFTLIELLVVVAIVAVLAGMLMPAVTQVRDAARSAGCTSGLRQIAYAAMAYADDHDSQVVAATLTANPVFGFGKVYHFYLLDQYLGKDKETSRQDISPVFWSCRTWRGDSALAATKGDPNSIYWLYPGYGINPLPGYSASTTNIDWAFASGNARNWTMPEITMSSSRMQFGDAKMDRLWLSGTTSFSPGYADTQRHRGRANYSFFDGHVASLLPAAALTAAVDPR